MAQLIRSAKSGSDWTTNELYAYNISIKPTSPANFFQGNPDPPLDHLDPSILTKSLTDGEDPNLSDATLEYLRYLDLATHATQDSLLDDFAAATLRLLGFRAPYITVATRYTTPLTICGEQRTAQTDVCLIHHPSTILLVLVEDRTIFNPMVAQDVEAQVIAEAIAVFEFNNSKRYMNGASTFDAMTIPCITMFGTTPTFYLVPVTKELSDAVITGQYPASQTQVLKCITTATHRRRISEGMADIEFRKIALRRFLAFKHLAMSHWQQYMN